MQTDPVGHSGIAIDYVFNPLLSKILSTVSSCGSAVWGILSSPVSTEQIFANSWSSILNSGIAYWDLVTSTPPAQSYAQSYAKEIANAMEPVAEAYQELKDALSEAKMKGNQSDKEPRCEENDHHVIAKRATGAQEARDIWTRYYDINDENNRLVISTRMHWFVHNKVYFDCVNVLVGAANELPIGNPAVNVRFTVGLIKELITTIDHEIN